VEVAPRSAHNDDSTRSGHLGLPSCLMPRRPAIRLLQCRRLSDLPDCIPAVMQAQRRCALRQAFRLGPVHAT
jgi:hypothetical protein